MDNKVVTQWFWRWDLWCLLQYPSVQVRSRYSQNKNIKKQQQQTRFIVNIFTKIIPYIRIRFIWYRNSRNMTRVYCDTRKRKPWIRLLFGLFIFSYGLDFFLKMETSNSSEKKWNLEFLLVAGTKLWNEIGWQLRYKCFL